MLADMPLTLLLLRHAKSSPGDPSLADMERPLNDRGEKAATRMGEYIARKKLVPERVLCSPALRTRQTWALAAHEMPSPPSATICPELYAFGDGTPLLAVLRSRGGKAKCVMLVSHNPSTHNLALRLVGSGNADLRQQLAEKYPTGALAVLTFDASEWTVIAEGTGKLERFIRPKELSAQD
jgi:phosphohistidine phosphatase